MQWHTGDSFVGPMRWDSRAVVGKPYYLLCDRRVYVSDGDWIVFDAGQYYPVASAVFERDFVSAWDWEEYEAGKEG